MNSVPRREIRSFVRREGRMTVSQKRALEQLWPKFGFGCGTDVFVGDAVGAGGAGTPVVDTAVASSPGQP